MNPVPHGPAEAGQVRGDQVPGQLPLPGMPPHPAPGDGQAPLPGFDDLAGLAVGDAELAAVAAELTALDPDGARTAAAIRGALDMLLDGQHTGRYRWDQLHKTENLVHNHEPAMSGRGPPLAPGSLTAPRAVRRGSAARWTAGHGYRNHESAGQRDSVNFGPGFAVCYRQRVKM